ncbi:MAG: RNA polymerase sporulation sigma factor SigF [Bacillota bacterium]
MTRLSNMDLLKTPLLSDEETRRLLGRAKEGDQEARERLVNSNLRLVWSLVQRFVNRGYEIDDLFQIGSIGLVKAIDKFDLQYDVKFSTYAVPMILGEIQRFLRDDHPIKISRSLKELVGKAHRAKDILTYELGREPSIAEIADRLGVTTQELVMAYEAVQAPSSLQEEVFHDDGDPIYLIDQVSHPGDEKASWLDVYALKEVLSRLEGRERQIIYLRYFKDKTQSEVAKVVGLSQVQVSRIEKKTLDQIRRMMAL